MEHQEKNAEIPPGARVQLRRRILSVPTLVSFLVATVFLIFLLTRLDIDFRELGSLLRQSNPSFYLLAVVVYYSTFPLRGLRWWLLLKNACRSEPGLVIPPFWRLGGLVLLGWFGNCISWVRLGDAYRAYLITEHSRVGFSRSMGTIVAERAFDVPIIFLLLVASAVSLWGFHPGSSVLTFAAIGLALVVALLVGLTLMRLLSGRLRRRLPGRLRSYYIHFEEGVLGGVYSLPVVAPTTFFIWLIEASSLFLVTRALGLEVAFPFAIFAYLGSSLLLTIPLTPGGLGIVEVGMAGLLTLRLAREAALSTTLLARSIYYGSVVVLGAILFAARQLLRRPAPVA